jgi:dihydrodipicolinate synthase/N-acetylneuraminate lyase
MGGPQPPKGLIVDLLTPVSHTGDIDGRSLGKYLDHLLPHAQGFLLGGRYPRNGQNLSPEQYGKLLEKTLVVVRGRIPILIRFSRENGDESKALLIHLNERLVRKSYDGPVFWVDTPLIYHSNRGLPDLYRDYASLIKGDFILYNDPERIKTVSRPLKRNNIRTSILKELCLNERIIGLIFSGTLDRSHHYQRAVKSRRDFRIYDGDESRFLNFPSRSGVISIGANIAPLIWSRVTRASLRENAGGEYLDSLKQLWEMGQFLEDLRDEYNRYGAGLIRQVLTKKGLINDIGPSEETELLREPVARMMNLLEKFEPGRGTES